MSITALDYSPSRLLRNPHLHTIYARFAREIVKFNFEWKDIELPDGDVLEIGESFQGSSRLVILVHGLEGKADAPYMRSTAKNLSLAGWDVLTWSFRGCGERPNRRLRSYHCGFTDDLKHLISIYHGSYQELALVGFSVGGSIAIKYLGEDNNLVPSNLQRVVAVSSPLDLGETADHLKTGINRIYLSYFLSSFKRKLRIKKPLYPNDIPDNFFRGIKNFEDYDDRYTAPWFNYRNARHYWKEASCRQFLNDVKIPLLFLTAEDDTFFRGKNIPSPEAKQNRSINLVTVPSGGHVGFFEGLTVRKSWMELSVLEFLKNT